MIKWEKQKQEQTDNASKAAGGKPKHGMKTLAETNRSKKSLKKEQKKLREAAGGENGGSGDEKADGGEGSPTETTPTSVKERLQLKLRNSSKKASGNS